MKKTKSVFMVVFGINPYNIKTQKYLEEQGYTVTKYNVFENTSIQKINATNFDCLILGGGKKTISIYQLLDRPKNANTNPLYETYGIINQFKDKPILSYGYGCLVLGLYYKCAVKPLTEPNKNDTQHIIVDNRYKINKSNLIPSNIKVTFNNENTIVVPEHNTSDTIMFQAKNRFEPCGFRFNTNHYGFLFRLVNSKYGQSIMSNFLGL